MDDKKILNIVKDCFAEKFDKVTFKTDRRNTQKHNNGYSSFSDVEIDGVEETDIYVLNLPDFRFVISKKVKYIIDDFATLSTSNISPTHKLKSVDESYDVEIFRLNGTESAIYKKKIITDKEFFDSLVKSITYDESKLEDDLNNMLVSLRSKKIDRLTDES